MSRKNIWHLPVAIIVVCVTMLFFGSISVSAEEYSGECGAEGDNLTWAFSEGTLTISGTGEMRYYQYGSAPWLNNCGSSITKVVIEDGVTSVSAYAFYECRHIQSVSFPETLTSIGDYAFQCIDDLTYAPLPASLETVGKYAFNQTHLTSVNLGENVKTIGKGAFSGGFDLETVTISGKNLTSIGEGAFSSCQKLETVTFSSDFKCYIANEMFHSCTSLNSINLPEGISSIGINAFYYCQSLKEITIPDSVTSLGNCAFQSTGLTSVTIPGNIQTIPTAAFSYCSNLASVTICEGVKEIEGSAFDYCPLLTTVSFPDSLEFIGNSAFNYSGLTSVTLSGNDLVIDDFAFSTCNDLRYVELLDGVIKIKEAFYDCPSLETVVIPGTIVEIYPYAFYNCEAITDIYCYPDAANLEWYYYSDSWNEYYNFGDSIPKIHVKAAQYSAYYDKYHGINAILEDDLDGIAAGTTARLLGHSVTLADLIGVNFYVNLSSAENVTVTFSWGVGDYAKTAKGTLVPVNQYGANYKITCGVAARCLKDYITMEIKRGDEVILTDSFSVIDYIKILGKTRSYYDDPTLHQLLYALERYGADSQRYFDYRTDETLPDYFYDYRYGIIDDAAETVVNNYWEDLDARTDLLIPDMPVKNIGNDRDLGISYYAASAVCASQTKIRLYFVVTDETKFAEVQAAYGSKELTFKTAKIGSQDVVYLETPGLYPAELIEPITITIAGVDYEYDYKDYMGKCIGDTSWNLKSVAKSLYTYSYFANKYKEAHNG